MHLRYGDVFIGCRRDSDLFLADITPPTTELRTNRWGRIGVDGEVPGQELLGSASWGFTLRTRASSTREVLTLAGQLEAAWKDPAARRSGKLTPLEYSTDHGATWFRVYGRPGLYTGPRSDFYASLGHGQIDLEFTQLDPLHYAGEEGATRLTAAASSVTDGWVAPFVFPLTSTVSGEPRAGQLHNAGDRPTPARVVFQGPGTNFRVWANGFEVGYTGTLAHDQTVTVDGLTRTATLRTAGARPRAVPGALTRRTRLSNLVAPPGTSNLWFEAEDPTGTSSVTVYWRNAYAAMQYDNLRSEYV